MSAIRRHPLTFLFCLLVTAGGGAAVWATVPLQYEAKTSYAVLPPSTVLDGNGKQIRVNPWQQAGSNASQIATSALATISAGQAFQRELASHGVTSITTVAVEAAGGGVVLGVSTTSPDPQAATRDQAVLVDALRATLQGQQDAVKAPAGSYLRMLEIIGATDPVPLTAGKVKLAGIAVALGLVLSLLTVVIAGDRRSPVPSVEAAGWTAPRPTAVGVPPGEASGPRAVASTVRSQALDRPQARGSQRKS